MFILSPTILLNQSNCLPSVALSIPYQEAHCLSNEDHVREVTALKGKMTAYKVGNFAAVCVDVHVLRTM